MSPQRLLRLATLAVLLGVRAAGAQPCAVARFDGAVDGRIGDFSGRLITRVDVESADPDLAEARGIGILVRRTHVRTRDATVRRFLRFAAGDTVDAIALAESLRNLRRVRFLSHVAMSVSCSPDSAGVVIRVQTRDAWSVRPTLRAGGNASASVLAVEEQNLLGSGRSGRLSLRSDNGHLGVGMQYADPWLAGRVAGVAVSRNVYGNGGDWVGEVHSFNRSVLDPWRIDAALARSTRLALAATGDSVIRSLATVVVERRVSASASGATSLAFGAEGGRTVAISSGSEPVIGPQRVRRAFTGIDAGITRRSASYAAVRRLVAGDGVAELPLGWEGDALLGVGADLTTHRPMLHADLWAGRSWALGNQSAIIADAWFSGFRSSGAWSSQSARISVRGARAARGGVWSGAVVAEQLGDPDPDVRALSSDDPAVRLFPSRGLAETALVASAERSLRLWRISRSYSLDVAPFAVASVRWDPASSSGDRLGAGVLGLSLRLAPQWIGRSMLRLDVGSALVRSAGIPSTPFVRFAASPGLGTRRHRDGRRDP